MPVDATTAERIVDEANASFHMNMAMFRELEGNWFVALTKFGWNSLLTKIKGEPKENSSARRESKAAS